MGEMFFVVEKFDFLEISIGSAQDYIFALQTQGRMFTKYLHES